MTSDRTKEQTKKIKREPQLGYEIYGSGTKILLAFHGFGQGKEHFKVLAKALGPEYSVFSFDLFFHGESHWTERDQPLTKETWKKMIRSILDKNGVDRFSLAGFSLGGKLVLAILEEFPSKIDDVFLIAPDGIKTNFWYRLATYPYWFRDYFRTLVRKPKSFFRLLNILDRLGLIDKALIRFSYAQMDTVQKRWRVYSSWIVFSKLNFNLSQVANLINQNKINILMFLGEYDRVIAPNKMQVFLGQIDHYKLEILKTGHSHLITEVASYIRNKGI